MPLLSTEFQPLEIPSQFRSSRRLDVWALLVLLFAISGCSALIYELIWYQLLGFVIGSTAVSLAVLLATFMGGLFLGSLLLPRFIALRPIHPLRVYGGIELGIGAFALFILFGVPHITGIYVSAIGHGFPAILLRGVISSICLLPPTILMGASLPAIARWADGVSRDTSWVGFLYTANIVGGVAGCFTAGFYLLRKFDIATATYVAITLNIVAAVTAFAISERNPQHVPTQSALRRGDRIANVWPLYAAVAISGTCALGAEVVWTRILGLLLGPTVYTFSIILAVFLMGLGLGSYIGTRLARFARPRAAIGYCQLLLTVAIAWTALMLARSIPFWPINPRLSTSPWFTFQLDLVRAIWALLPPTILWGTTFPLGLAVAANRDDDPARPVGGIYAANTCGAIIGALIFSLVLIPRIGTQGSERLLILLSAAAAGCMFFPLARSWQMRRGLIGATISIIIVTALIVCIPPIPPRVVAYGRLLLTVTPSQILYVGEGLNSSIAISQSGNIRQFHVSGKSEASNDTYDMRVERTLGDLPILLHADPQTALVVGFGAGITAGSFVADPHMRRIVICEIEPLVPRTSSFYFNKENSDVFHDRRTEVVYEDARNYILTTREKFDIITSDPIHPWVKGSASLYTSEYFELVKQHLNPGGLVTQWVPLYETDMESVKSEIATFFSVFPYGSVWANDVDGHGYDVVLLGHTDPLKIDVEKVQERFNSPDFSQVAQSLSEIGFHSAVELLSTYGGQARDLKPWLEGAEINRDGNLRLQYLAGLALNTDQADPIYRDILGYRRFPLHLFTGPVQLLQAIHDQHDWE